LLRDNTGWLLAGLVAAAVVFSAGACGGDGESTDKASGGHISFRQATITPGPTLEVVGPPGPSEACVKVRDVSICVPTTFTLSLVVRTGAPPWERTHIFQRGDSEVRIDADTGQIVMWDVAPEDEEEFNRLIREPLEEVGY
jgi:hypothetical protein